MRLRTTIALAIALLIVIANQSGAAVIYSTTGSTYSQNFDTLPTAPTYAENASLGTTANGAGWKDDSTTLASNQFSILGWYLYHPTAASEGGVNGHQRLRVGAGTQNTGAFMSFGASQSTERALGDVGSTTLTTNPGPMYFGVRFTNNTTDTLTSVTIQYTGEQWRHGNNPAGTDKFTVSATAAPTTDVTNWADQLGTNADLANILPGLTFATPTGGTNDVGLDGNLPANRGTVSATFGVSWAPGTDLWVRFNEQQVLGNDDGLGIDDFSLTADVPEPSSLMLLSAAVVGLGLTMRRWSA